MARHYQRTIATAITFRVPVAFDLEAHFVGRDRDYAAYLLNGLHRHALRGGTNPKYARLKRRILTKYIPNRRLTEIMQALERLGVIDVDHSYRVGVRSKGYRLHPDYVESREVVCRTGRLAARIREHNAECERSLLPVHRRLRSQFRRLQFDHVRAEEIISKMLPKSRSKLTVDQYHDLLREHCKRIQRTKQGGMQVDRYGRVHTVITNMPSSLRPCLSVDSQNLVGIDISSSQPLICGIVAKRYAESADARYRMITRNFEDRATPYVTQEIEAMRRQVEESSQDQVQGGEALSIMWCKTDERTSNTVGCESRQPRPIPSDLSRYLRLCEKEGGLYQYLMKPGDDRTTFKKRVFADIYYGRPCYPSELRDGFELEFSTVGNMLRALKRSNYRHPARLMQSYEATMIIAIICRRLLAEHPNIPIFTIHDSILTVPSAVDLVRGVMLEEFGLIGVRPPLKVEPY